MSFPFFFHQFLPFFAELIFHISPCLRFFLALSRSLSYFITPVTFTWALPVCLDCGRSIPYVSFLCLFPWTLSCVLLVSGIVLLLFLVSFESESSGFILPSRNIYLVSISWHFSPKTGFRWTFISIPSAFPFFLRPTARQVNRSRFGMAPRSSQDGEGMILESLGPWVLQFSSVELLYLHQHYYPVLFPFSVLGFLPFSLSCLNVFLSFLRRFLSIFLGLILQISSCPWFFFVLSISLSYCVSPFTSV